MLKTQLLDSSRGRIVSLLQGTGLTADDLASKLGLTRSAVRAQLTAMERDGMVRRAGQRPGTTRPSLVFKLTAEVEQLLSGAYIPLLTQLVDVFADGLPPISWRACFEKPADASLMNWRAEHGLGELCGLVSSKPAS